MQWFLLLALLSVFAALATAAYFLLGKPPGQPNTDSEDDAAKAERAKHMAHAMAWRVALSLTLVLFLLIAYALGWIQPHAGFISR